jgi:hypothetical protein
MTVSPVIDRLVYLCDTIPAKLRQIPDADFMFRRAAGQKEILGHLIDSATNNHQRFVRAIVETAPAVAYDGDDRVNAQHYQEQDRALMLQFWESYNRLLAGIIGKIKEDDLIKTCRVKEDVLTLQFLIEDYLRHLEHHLKQLVGTL